MGFVDAVLTPHSLQAVAEVGFVDAVLTPHSLQAVAAVDPSISKQYLSLFSLFETDTCSGQLAFSLPAAN